MFLDVHSGKLLPHNLRLRENASEHILSGKSIIDTKLKLLSNLKIIKTKLHKD